MLYSGYLLRAAARVMRPSGRANEVGVLKGSVSRPRSISTYLMGGGLVLLLIGFFFGDILILFPGALLFGGGILLAVIEAIFEK